MNPYLKFLDKLILPTFFIIITILFLHPFEGGGDFYHHVNTGKQIIELKSFPFTDIYTHTAEGQPWIAYAWGSGIIFYLIYSYFGPVGISILTALIGTLTITLLFYYLRLSNTSKAISFLLCFIATGLILTRFPNRPEIFTYPLVLSILIIDKLRLKHPRLSWVFPLIILIWTNFYGSGVVSGLVLIFVLALRQLLVDRPKIQKSQLLFYLCSLLSVAAAFINPNTYKSVFYVYIYIPKVSQYEGEWAGISTILTQTPEGYVLLYQYLILIYFIYLALFLIVSTFGLKKILKNKFAALLALGIFIPIFTFRQLPLAAILSAPLIGYFLSQVKSRVLNILTICCAISILAIMLWLKPIGINVDTSPQDKLISFIKSNNLSGKAFNHNTTGSFLSYSLYLSRSEQASSAYPGVKIFFDTRDDLYKDSQSFTDLYNAQMSGQNLIPLLEKYKIDLVVADFFTDGLNYRDLFKSSQWSVVYFDDRYFIAIPTQTAKTKNLEPLTWIDPFSPTGSIAGEEAKAENYYRSITPTDSNKLLLTQTLLSQGKTPEAINVLENLSKPQGPAKVLFQKQTDYFLVKAYLEVSSCQNAQTTLERLQNEVKGNFIFDPNKNLPLIDDDIQALYYLKCQKDKTKADFYMKKYLNRPDINPKEKIKFQQHFEEFSQ